MPKHYCSSIDLECNDFCSKSSTSINICKLITIDVTTRVKLVGALEGDKTFLFMCRHVILSSYLCPYFLVLCTYTYCILLGWILMATIG